MSTKLGKIPAKIEIPDVLHKESRYLHTKINLTRFYGGDKRGTSVQLGFYAGNHYCHVQVSQKDIRNLIDLLEKCVIKF